MITLGTRIGFAEEKRPYRVRARNQRYIVIALEEGEYDIPKKNGADIPDFLKQFLHRKP